ncbi:MAG TPA: hypothetical protein VF885_12555, partial [Arthrobacter sp.]
EADPGVFEKIAALPVNRPAGAVLETPLTPYEIGARVENDGTISGLSVMTLSDLIGHDAESLNDQIGRDLVGAELLMEPTVTPVSVRPDGSLTVRLEGNASELIDHFNDDQLDQYEAGRTASTTEGAS